MHVKRAYVYDQWRVLLPSHTGLLEYENKQGN